MYTLSCVSLQVTKKPAVQTGRFSPYPAIYAAARSAQPPDFTDILRTSYLAWRAISCIIAECAFSDAPLSYNNTSVCVKGLSKKILQFCRICPNLFSAPSSCGLRPPPGTRGQRPSASRLFKTSCRGNPYSEGRRERIVTPVCEPAHNDADPTEPHRKKGRSAFYALLP